MYVFMYVCMYIYIYVYIYSAPNFKGNKERLGIMNHDYFP